MNLAVSQAPNGATQLEAVRLASDCLAVSAAGVLEIDGADVAGPLDRFGSPLNVIVERTLRANYRRARQAFSACWPAPLRIL